MTRRAALSLGHAPGLSDTPLEPVTLRSSAARRLRLEILSGQLDPETLYPIAEVAKRLGVSITPVREALLELAADGLVEIQRNRGFRITHTSDKDLDDIVDLRVVLENYALEKLPVRIPEADMARLRELAEQTRAALVAEDLTT